MKTILKKIGSKIDKFFITFLSTFTSIKKYTLILESEGDFTDNIKAFYDYLIKNRINDYIKIIWFVHNP